MVERCWNPINNGILPIYQLWLVVDLPLWKIWKSVGKDYPIHYGNTKNVWNHQPDIYLPHPCLMLDSTPTYHLKLVPKHATPSPATVKEPLDWCYQLLHAPPCVLHWWWLPQLHAPLMWPGARQRPTDFESALVENGTRGHVDGQKKLEGFKPISQLIEVNTIWLRKWCIYTKNGNLHVEDAILNHIHPYSLTKLELYIPQFSWRRLPMLQVQLRLKRGRQGWIFSWHSFILPQLSMTPLNPFRSTLFRHCKIL